LIFFPQKTRSSGVEPSGNQLLASWPEAGFQSADGKACILLVEHVKNAVPCATGSPRRELQNIDQYYSPKDRTLPPFHFCNRRSKLPGQMIYGRDRLASVSNGIRAIVAPLRAENRLRTGSPHYWIILKKRDLIDFLFFASPAGRF